VLRQSKELCLYKQMAAEILRPATLFW